MKTIPKELLEVVESLPGESRIESFERGGMGWVARIDDQRSLFQLVSDSLFPTGCLRPVASDRGYIDVERIVDGRPQSIVVPDELRLEFTPKQVAELIASNAP